MITEYRTLVAWGNASLDEKVAAAIEDGWQPLGGVSLVPHTDRDGGTAFCFAQAMVRYAEPAESRAA